MIRVSTIGLVLFILFTLIGCEGTKSNLNTPSNAAVSAVKMNHSSVEELLKAHSHLTIEERIALYHRFRKEKGNEYDFKEEELNNYGHSLIKENLTVEAIEIFKLNTAQFPKSAKAYDELADAYQRYSNEIHELSKASREKAIKLWGILEMDATWGAEIFHFPLRFAKTIGYKGIEEARFPKGWSDTTSNYFWTYLFAWNIDLDTPLTVSDLESDLQTYFDGLMNSINRDNLVLKKTVAQFQKVNTTGNSRFKGTVEIFDGFKTKQPLTLNAMVESHYCKEKNTSQILFRFSPKTFEHEVWEKLEEATFSDDVCDI